MATAGQQKQQQQEPRGASAAIFEEAEEYVPISERPEWAGVVPRPLPAQAVPVVEIARDQQFGDLMDYFWASVEAQVGRGCWADGLVGACRGWGWAAVGAHVYLWVAI